MAETDTGRRKSLRQRSNISYQMSPRDSANAYKEVVATTLNGRKTRQSTKLSTCTARTVEATQVKLSVDAIAENIVTNRERETSPSNESNSSNIENIEVRKIKALNETTPRAGRLSRNRPRKNDRVVGATPCFQASPRKDGVIGIKLRKIPEQPSTPIRKLPDRSSRYKGTPNLIIYSDSDSDSAEDTSKHDRRSYFTEEDRADYVPEESSTEDDDADQKKKVSDKSGSESDEDFEEDFSSEDEKKNSTFKKLATPQTKLLSHDFAKTAMTPELLKKVEGRAIKRLAVDSPIASGNLTMSPNPENYFLAENRIKYKKRSKLEHVPNDSMKGRKGRRRKLVISAKDRLPEYEIPPNFSVTVEAMKATVDLAHFISGSSHDEEKNRILKNIVDNQFPDWLGLFAEGFNIMVYGYGSKLPIFREFENRYGADHLIVRVNGLFPKLNARKFLYGVCENIISEGRVPHGTNLEGVAKEIVALLNSEDHSDVFILVNNFDTMALRQPQMLSMLCWLSQVRCIKILAGSDTVNAFLGVTQSQALFLKFCWMHCPTFVSYREECKWHPGIYGDETRSVTQKSSLKYVLQSLTGNARKAFAMLAQMQLKQMKSHANKKSKDKEAYAGVRFQQLAKECREKFIAHSDDNLRTLLVEFFDHKLIRQSGKGKQVENMLLVELDIDTLEEIMPELI